MSASSTAASAKTPETKPPSPPARAGPAPSEDVTDGHNGPVATSPGVPAAHAPTPSAASGGDGGANAISPPAAASLLSIEDLENTTRNGKKKLYWSAFEVVIASAVRDPATGEEAVHESRHDAYQANHNHLKKLHHGAGGKNFVRVECKFCRNPRFTQSITVSTKKFEEHYMTLHALDALATANANSAVSAVNASTVPPARGPGKRLRAARAVTRPMPAVVMTRRRGRKAESETEDEHDVEEHDEDDEVELDEDDDDEDYDGHDDAGDAHASEDEGRRPKRRRRTADNGASAKHDRGAQAAAAAVVALSSTPAAGGLPPPPTAEPMLLAVDGKTPLDPADSDTKRVKKPYWTAYEVVITETVFNPETNEPETRETRQDAWRVNHNALRRLHLESGGNASVRVECRHCTEHKFAQSITVSTKKFEHHYYQEHCDAPPPGAASSTSSLLTGEGGAAVPAGPKRRKSWRALMMEKENTKRGALASVAVLSSPSTAGLRPANRHQHALLLEWLLADRLPLSIVDSPGFGRFAMALDRRFQPIDSGVVGDHLQSLYRVTKSEIQRLIRDERAVGTAFALSLEELTTAADRVHIAVTIHFVGCQWEPCRLPIACRAVPMPCGVDQVRGVLTEVITEFGLTDAITGITTSNDELVVSAMAALWPRQSPGTGRPGPVHLRCAARSLHTIAQAGVESISRTMEAVQTIVGRQGGGGDDNNASQELTDVPSRWINSYEMLVRALEFTIKSPSPSMDAGASESAPQPPPVTATTAADPSQTRMLSAEDAEVVRAAVALLEPFHRVAQDMGDAGFPSMSMIFQFYRHLKATLDAVLADESPAATRALAEVLGAAMRELYAQVITVDALVPYVLDPRFRFLHVDSDVQGRVRAKIEGAMREIRGDEDPSPSSPASAVTVSSGRVASGRRSFFEELATGAKASASSSSSASASSSSRGAGSRRTSLTHAVTMSVAEELDAYLALDHEAFGVDVLEWWRTREPQFPVLAVVARRALALVGTSLPCGSLFTRSGQLLAARRSAIEPEHLEAMLVTQALREATTPPLLPAKPARRPAHTEQGGVTYATNQPGPVTMPVSDATDKDKDDVAVI